MDLRQGITAALAGVAASLALVASASAATITVNSTVDEAGADNGQCALREAVLSADADTNVGGCSSAGTYGANDVIEIPGGTYTLTIPGNGGAAEGDLNLGSVVLRGVGPGPVTITQSVEGQRIIGAVGATVVLENLILQGSVKVNGSGGLVHVTADRLEIRNSTLTGGSAVFDGGAISSIQGGADELVIENSTITGNSADDNCGGLALNGGDPRIVNSTITNNTADADDDFGVDFGGGFHAVGGADPAFVNSIVAGNTVVGDGSNHNCSGVAGPHEGVNVFGTQPGPFDCHPQPADIVTDDAGLLPLADNGGPTPTHALAPSSPALDKGLNCPPADQRGVERFLGGACDVGAYELVTCEGQPANRVGTPGDDTLTGTEGDDVFLLLGGNDTAIGLGGNDVACGGPGDDTLDGGDGNDRLVGEGGNDVLLGGDGGDALLGGSGDDRAVGGDGNDTANLGDGADKFDGGIGNDRADLGEGNDRAKGGAGKDVLQGKAGRDVLKGGAGKDKLNGGPGKDKLNGGPGKDKCVGSGGKDRGKSCEKTASIP